MGSNPAKIKVGVAGFEPTTSCSQSRRDTGLRYTPKVVIVPAEREGFEPSVPLPVRQFSKLFLSATQASLRDFLTVSLSINQVTKVGVFIGYAIGQPKKSLQFLYFRPPPTTAY